MYNPTDHPGGSQNYTGAKVGAIFRLQMAAAELQTLNATLDTYLLAYSR